MTNDKIIIFDTTLRDGEQSPGATMSRAEKVQIACALDTMGVDVIEAGFAVASKGDFECINEIANTVKNSVVCSLARATEGDIKAAGEAIKLANKSRIHTFISISDVHIKHKLKSTKEDVLEMARKSVKYARNFTNDVEWSAEDATRTDIDFLLKCIEEVINAGATTINIPDTVGYTYPSEYIAMINTIMNKVPNIDKAIISTHCHDDLGMAVANSLAAVQAGARQVECTVNGIGERAGNAAMEEIIMAIKTRNDILPFTTNIDTTHISNISKLVANISGFAVQKNKAIVGKNAFSHESGIHQDGMLKARETYEIMTPESVGIKKSELVLGKHSGRAAFEDKLKELGLELDKGGDNFKKLFEKFKLLGDKKKHILDEDIIALVTDSADTAEENIFKLISYNVNSSSDIEKTASINVQIADKEKTFEGSGDGVLDAIFNAVREIVSFDVDLEQYDVNALTEGTDAQANASVVLKCEGIVFSGSYRDTDTVFASAQAFMNALNKIVNHKEYKLEV